jgi:hypothetical protein
MTCERHHKGGHNAHLQCRLAELRPAFQDRNQRTDRNDTSAARSLAWALLEALACAGAFIDPSGVLAGQRLRRSREQEQRRGHGEGSA